MVENYMQAVQNINSVPTGRKVFYTSQTELGDSIDKAIDFLKPYWTMFTQKEQPEIAFLYQFDKGIQPILDKKRDELKTANNLVVVNLARAARKLIQSAFLGEELQYINKDTDNENTEKALAALVSIYKEEDEAEHNMLIEDDLGICGVAYEFVGVSDDETPIMLSRLNPLHTKTIKDSGLSKENVAAFTYYPLYEDNNALLTPTGFHFYLYTKTKIYEFETDNNLAPVLSKNGITNWSITDNPINRLPIIEYINNPERMGDFEPAISILNVINSIYSKRADNIEDIVDSFLVFVNTTIYDPIYNENGQIVDYDNTRLEAFKKNKAIEIVSKDGQHAEVKHMVNTLDQTEVQVMVDSLIALSFAIMGAPNPITSRAKGSSDSAEAVMKNEGWQTLEDLLKAKERFFRKSLKRRMACIKAMSQFDTELSELSIGKTDIRFIRTKYLNSQSNAQAILTLKQTGLFDPDTIVAISNLVENPVTEREKIFAELEKLVADEVITDVQAKMFRLSYFFPTDVVKSFFPTTETNVKGVNQNE